jgi:hypothetical protein
MISFLTNFKYKSSHSLLPVGGVEAHRNLLGLGLKFVPTNQKIDMTELIADVKEWERRMHLREFFFDQNEKEDVLTDDQKQYNFIKKKKSNWTPPTGRSEWLDLYLKLVKNDIISGVKQKYRINLDRAEEEAFTVFSTFFVISSVKSFSTCL